MKNFIILFISLFLLQNSFAQEVKIPEAHAKVVQLFLSGVTDHSDTKIIKAMDKSYRKEQLKFVKGNTEQFINELFGGEDLNTHKYVNQEWKGIKKIDLYSIIKDKEGNYKYIFRSNDGQSDILFTLYLIQKGHKYGFEGSRG